MKDKYVPFVIEKGSVPFVKTMIYDFYMFILLIVYYLFFVIFALPALALDYAFKCAVFTDSVKSFFRYVANL